MTQRNILHPENIPASNHPQIADGELGTMRDKWIDEGCLPVDSTQDALRHFENMALSGQLTVGAIEEIHRRLAKSRNISERVAQSIRDILGRVVIPSARLDIVEEIANATNEGDMSEQDRHIIRKMIEVQRKEGNLSLDDYVDLLDMIDFHLHNS